MGPQFVVSYLVFFSFLWQRQAVLVRDFMWSLIYQLFMIHMFGDRMLVCRAFNPFVCFHVYVNR